MEVKFGKQESSKFSILLQEEKQETPEIYSKLGMADLDDEDLSYFKIEEKKKHKCKIFGPLKKGTIESLDPKPKF